MWKKWEERLTTFGSDEISFVTSKRGGKKDRNVITQAKCILKFYPKKAKKDGSCEDNVVIQDIVSKLVCSEMMKVSVTSDDNFLHVCKDSISGDMYGTKEGWPAFELTPTDINESRGTEKFKPGIIVARVFRIKARKKWVAAGRRAFRNEFIGEKHTVFLVYLKGAYWGSAAPPDTEGQPKPDLFRDAICYINEDNHDRCIYEFGKMADVLEVLYKFETKTYTKWKGFRGKGLLDLKKK